MNKRNLIRFLRQKRSPVVNDAVFLFVIAIFIYLVGYAFGLFDLLDTWIERVELAHFDEFLLLLILGFVIYSVRRWRDLRAEINKHKQAEAALAESRGRWRAIFDNALDVMLLANDEACYIDVNPAACALTGYSRAELLDMGVWNLTPIPNREHVQVLWRDFIAAGRQSGDYTLRCRDGTLVEMEYRAVANIVPGLHLSIMRDVTERKRAEEALWQSEVQLRAILTSMPMTIFATDRQGVFTLSEGKGLDRVGLKPGDNVGVSALELYGAMPFVEHTGVVIQGQDIVRRALAGETITAQNELNGVYFDNHIGPLRDSDGRVIGVVGVAADITERKQIEDELNYQKERLQKIVDNIPVMIAFISPDGETEWVNREWQRVLGWTLEEAQTRDLLPEMYPDPAERQAVLDFALHPPSGWGDFRTTIKDGRVLDTAWANVLLSDESSIGIGQDISERKQAERSLRQYAGRLEIQHQIDQAVLAARSPETIAESVLTGIWKLIPYVRASIVMFDLEAYEGEVVVVRTDGESRLGQGVRISLELFGDIEKLKQGQIHTVENVADLPHTIPELPAIQADRVRSYLNLPLIAGGELLGTLNLGSARVGAFTLEQVAIAREIADSLAVAIQDARLFEQVQAAHDRLHRLSRRLLAVQETERRAIALELHDQIGQNLTAIKLTLQAAQRMALAAPLLPVLQQSLTAVEGTLDRVRNLSLDLRPSMLDDLGLAAALRWYVDRLARQANLAITFTAKGLETRPDSTLETTCFRVAQEALTNVVRHAQAQQVQVELWQQNGELNLLIRDDGRGFDAAATLTQAAQGASVGLLGMQERVELTNGRLEIDSAVGYGTEIRACFPLSNSERDNS